MKLPVCLAVACVLLSFAATGVTHAQASTKDKVNESESPQQATGKETGKNALEEMLARIETKYTSPDATEENTATIRFYGKFNLSHGRLALSPQEATLATALEKINRYSKCANYQIIIAAPPDPDKKRDFYRLSLKDFYAGDTDYPLADGVSLRMEGRAWSKFDEDEYKQLKTAEKIFFERRTAGELGLAPLNTLPLEPPLPLQAPCTDRIGVFGAVNLPGRYDFPAGEATLAAVLQRADGVDSDYSCALILIRTKEGARANKFPGMPAGDLYAGNFDYRLPDGTTVIVNSNAGLIGQHMMSREERDQMRKDEPQYFERFQTGELKLLPLEDFMRDD